MKDQHAIRVRLRKRDRERLEMIRDHFGISLSGGVRAALLLMCRHLGFEKDTDPLIKK